MTPLNQAERRKTFWNFLLFFVITVGVILASVLFSFNVPIKEAEKLRKESEAIKNERPFIDEFEAKMLETMNLLDSVNLAVNPYRIDSRISGNLTTMTEINSKDINSLKTMFARIIENLNTLQSTKAQLRSVFANAEEIAKKDREITELKQELRQREESIMQLRRE